MVIAYYVDGKEGFDGNDAIRSDDQSAHSHGRDNAG